MNSPAKQSRRKVDGILLLDKAAGMTSNAALQKVRRLFNAAKAGHTGTLDPMATGLLPVCFGEATKFAGELLTADKCYEAHVRLGVRTDTADAEGQVLETRPVAVSRPQVVAAMARFRGDILQVPPMHSALKRDGRPLYEYARKGIELERAPRAVTIHALELLAFSEDRIEFKVACSKGTYVRTLAQNIGEALGCGAHLSALRRTRIGDLSLDAALTLDALQAMTPEARETLLLPVDALLAVLPRLDLDEDAALRFRHGQAVPAGRNPVSDDGRLRIYGAGDRFIGLGRAGADGRVMPLRLIGTGFDN
ncbi:MAG: tRNA pseudouridine(55) synthase TruB [Betaproteobacteria bacterium HGW-Betaproteobacteria-14]|nr:MAG: tRNA pseudouridine(55) synthase TruB [Betaproteobacteria bacterium HGW-Betaproteobacteria-14]